MVLSKRKLVDRARGLSCAWFEHLSRGHPPVRAEGRGDARDALRHVSARERGGHHRHLVDSILFLGRDAGKV